MAADFRFFMQPNKLLNQPENLAYGRVQEAGVDAFRVSDLHNASSGPDAYAICGGLVRAQADDESGITLILKPDDQPPFDFPFVCYYLYKGIDPASLLSGGLGGLVLKPDGNDLLRSINKVWAANGNKDQPSRDCLGLQLSDAFDPARYGPDSPLDNLFYSGGERFHVRAGDHLGTFLQTRFGLDIVVERFGSPAPIHYSRTRESRVLGPSPATAPFKDRQDREEVLRFVDPCAFWGSFRVDRLHVGSTRVPGPSIYEGLLVGPSGGRFRFFNRNAAYVDIRDGHGHSFNYYRATDDDIGVAVGGVAPSFVPYYDDGKWPSFTLPATAGLSGGDAATVDIRLPVAMGSQSHVYVAAGYRATRLGGIEPVREKDRFPDPPFLGGDHLEPVTLAIPLAEEAGQAVIHACYQRLLHFRRGMFEGSGPDPTMDTFLVPGAGAFPRTITACTVRTYNDLVLVDAAKDWTVVVARPGIARDANNVYLFLLPVAGHRKGKTRAFRADAVAFMELTTPQFRPDEILLHIGDRLDGLTISPVGMAGASIGVVQDRSAGASPQSDNFWAVAMSAADYNDALAALGSPLPMTTTLALEASLLATDPGGPQYETRPSKLYWVPDPPAGARADAPFQELYRVPPP